MPSRGSGGLATGAGIAQGVSAFTQAFMQARQQKNMMELNKNDRLASLLMEQIRDDNTPHSKRTALIDEYQKLYDPKGASKMPLSQILGLHKIDDQDYQIGTQKVNPKVPTINPDETVNSVTAPEAQNLNQPVFKKYGDLSNNDIKTKLQNDLESVRDQRQVDHAIQLYKAQNDILRANNYVIPISESYDPDTKTYRKIMGNNAGDTKVITLENFKPATLMKAEITAKGSDAPKGKLGLLQKANEIVSAYEADPNSFTKPQYSAAKQFLDDFEKTGQVKDATVANLNQSISGTKPVTPAQEIDDQRARDQMRLGLQTSYDNFTAQSIAASTDAANKAQDANYFYENSLKPLQNELKELDKDAPEYASKERQIASATREYNHLKALSDIANRHDTTFKEQAAAAKKRIEDFDSKKPNKVSTKTITSSPIKTMSAQDKADVAKVKSNPKNAAAIAGMSDQAILDYINAHRRK